MVNLDVEYCGECGHGEKYNELKQVVLNRVPETKMNGSIGRQASFEVEVNKILIYSKLKTMAFPDFNEVADIVEDNQVQMEEILIMYYFFNPLQEAYHNCSPHIALFSYPSMWPYSKE